ncbi:hypothetical protein AcV5_001506 [Taiwanofungus camphoratus]|nr:hypothetical protein AcV5_001506 [Antrodia cinnamomea]
MPAPRPTSARRRCACGGAVLVLTTIPARVPARLAVPARRRPPGPSSAPPNVRAPSPPPAPRLRPPTSARRRCGRGGAVLDRTTIPAPVPARLAVPAPRPPPGSSSASPTSALLAVPARRRPPGSSSAPPNIRAPSLWARRGRSRPDDDPRTRARSPRCACALSPPSPPRLVVCAPQHPRPVAVGAAGPFSSGRRSPRPRSLARPPALLAVPAPRPLPSSSSAPPMSALLAVPVRRRPPGSSSAPPNIRAPSLWARRGRSCPDDDPRARARSPRRARVHARSPRHACAPSNVRAPSLCVRRGRSRPHNHPRTRARSPRRARAPSPPRPVVCAPQCPRAVAPPGSSSAPPNIRAPSLWARRGRSRPDDDPRARARSPRRARAPSTPRLVVCVPNVCSPCRARAPSPPRLVVCAPQHPRPVAVGAAGPFSSGRRSPHPRPLASLCLRLVAPVAPPARRLRPPTSAPRRCGRGGAVLVWTTIPAPALARSSPRSPRRACAPSTPQLVVCAPNVRSPCRARAPSPPRLVVCVPNVRAPSLWARRGRSRPDDLGRAHARSPRRACAPSTPQLVVCAPQHPRAVAVGAAEPFSSSRRSPRPRPLTSPSLCKGPNRDCPL